MTAKTPAQLDREIAQILERRKRDPGAWSSRDQLVAVARAAAAAVFASRKTAPTAPVIAKAQRAAFTAIQRHDPLAGTNDHPVAAYAHGISALAYEGTQEAQQRWEAARGAAGTRRSAHSTVVTRAHEYVVYPDASHRHAERAVKVPTRRGKGPYDLTDAKRAAKQMGSPAAIYSVSKGRFVGYVHSNGRYVAFR